MRAGLLMFKELLVRLDCGGCGLLGVVGWFVGFVVRELGVRGG